MNRKLVVAGAIAALVTARFVRVTAVDARTEWPKLADIPYAPTPDMAPYVTLGYRELAADLLWIRLLGYLGGREDTADGVRGLVEGIAGLDERFRPVYDAGAIAIESADHGVDNAAHWAAIRVLEQGIRNFPERWQYPYYIGQIYVVDLVTSDPAERRAWNEQGIRYLERAVRMPGAPPGQATLAAHLQSQLGRHEAAVNNLKEMILLTNDPRAQRQLIEKLAELEKRDVTELAIATLDEQRAFQKEWLDTRPALPATMYLLLGPRRDPYAAPGDLAVTRDLIGTNAPEPMEPLFDE